MFRSLLKPFVYGLLAGLLAAVNAPAQQFMVPPPAKGVGQPPSKDLFVVQMTTDRRGHLWATSRDGLLGFDGQRWHVAHDPAQPTEDRYNRLAAAPDGRIWLRQSRPGRTGRLVYFDPGKQHIVSLPDTSYLVRTWLNQYDLADLFIDHQGQLWLGLTNGGLLRVNPNTLATTRVFRQPITVQGLAQGPDHTLWLATTHGLHAIDPQTGQTRYSQRDTTLSQGEITALRVRANGDVVIGRYNEIDLLTPRTGALRRIRLPLPTPTSQLWTNKFVTDRLGNDYFSVGVMVFRLTRAGELQRLEFARPAEKVISIAISPGPATSPGWLWVNAARRLDRYDLSRLRPLPALNVLDVIVNGTRLIENEQKPEERFQRDATGQASLSVQEGDFVQLRFAPFAELTKNTVFRYKLAGYDLQWTSYDDQLGTVTYQPPSGQYTFLFNRVGHGDWEKQLASIHVRVQPPYWKTAWFITLVLSSALGLLVWGVRATNRRQKLRQELARRQGEADSWRQLSEQRNQFFANVTHEFRTPLTILLNATETLTGASLTAREQDRLAAIQRNAHQLLRLINQALDLARLDAGQVDFHARLGDPVDVVAQVVAQFQGLAERNAITLLGPAELLTTQSAGGLYQFDDTKLETIVYNLLANAIKFTPAGGQVRVEAHIAPGSQLLVQIVDTGIGIAADQLSSIFERFYQVDTSPTRAYSGTGIGLALVRELTETLGGQITVTSEAGRGSTFKVTLPLTPPGPVPPASLVTGLLDGMPDHQPDLVESSAAGGLARPPLANPVAPGAPSTGRPLVLVVEDNTDMRAYMDEALAGAYQVILAEGGQQGLALAIEHVPDLIISDVMMPELDGFELVTRLKGDERTSHIPVILLTAKASPDSRLTGLSAGADDYLTKPFSLAELSLRVGNGLRTRQRWHQWLMNRSGSIPSASVDTAPATILPDKEAQFLNRLRQQILTHLDYETLDVDWLAQQANMSRTQLHRKLTALTSLSPNRFMHRVRLERAAELLGTGELTVAQAAYQVGYSSASHFSRVFQEHFGYVPSQLKL